MQHQPIRQRLARFAIALHLRSTVVTTVGASPSTLSSAAQRCGSFSSARPWMKQRGGGRDEAAAKHGAAPHKPRVVIVGAGMAGIAAAQRLQQQFGAGRFELTVLEASNRIGGRILSSEFHKEGIELGATWIHGIEGSPLYKMALQIGAMHNDERTWEMNDAFVGKVLLKAEGGLEVAPELVEPVEKVYKQLLQDAQEPVAVQVKEMVGGATAVDTVPIKITESTNCTNLGAYLQQGLDTFLARHYHMSTNPHGGSVTSTEGTEEERFGSPWTTRSLQEACFKMQQNLERIITSADDLHDIDLEDYNEYWQFPGEHKAIAKGYSSIVEAFACSLSPGVVQFGKTVEKIVWKNSCADSSAPVVVYCNGGSVVEADHVIITVSLGVLKAKALGSLENENKASVELKGESPEADCASKTMLTDIEKGTSRVSINDQKMPTVELFDPPLPTWKLNSISKLGFGVVDKVFVQIEPAVKGDEHKTLQFIFDNRGGRSNETGSIRSDIPTWIRKIFSLYPINKKSHSLVMWFVGREALEVESLSDEEIWSGISKMLASFGIPASEQGNFVDIRRSQWGTNPLFRGSYSYVKVGSSGEDIDVLAEPLPKFGDGSAAPLQILFAGEATDRHYYSTTHGAYLSGLREAERLLQHYSLLT